MTAVVLAAFAAFFFGAMTVLVRIALRNGADPSVGTFFTILPATVVTAVAATVHGNWDFESAWPFLLAGLLAPGIAQVLFTIAVRDAGASRTSVTVGTAPLFSVATALVFLDEPLVAGLVFGAALIVGGGIVLALDPDRPAHFKRIGLAFALVGTIAFATRDTVVRWLATDVTDVDPAVAGLLTMVTGTALALAVVFAKRAPISGRAGIAFVPAGLCYGLSYVCLFEAFFRGRVSVVSPLVATESLWGVTLSWLVLRQTEQVGRRLVLGAVLIVSGGVLIGINR
jgi:drug/metabolite transporter (DMT)-like permease